MNGSEAPKHLALEIALRLVAALVAALGIALTWLTNLAVISATLLVLAGISQLAQVGRAGAAAVDERLQRLGDRVATVEESADQLARNVADKGLVMTLLPAEQEAAVQAAAVQASQGFQNIQTAAETAAGLRRAVDGALGLLTGSPPQPPERSLVAALAGLEADAQALGADIRDFREGRAAKVERLAAAAGRLNARLAEARASLTRLDGDLARLQAGLDSAGRAVRVVFGLTAFLATLAFLYVIWGQAVRVRRLWADRAGAAAADAEDPGR